MIYQESIDVIAAIMRCWPLARDWTEEHAGQWVDDLAPLDSGRSLQAVKDCHQQHHYPPSWAQFHDAYRAVTFRELDPSRKAPATRVLEAGFVPKAESARRWKAMRAALPHIISQAAHNHHPKTSKRFDSGGEPMLDEHGEQMTVTVRGVEACPVCRLHDRNEKGEHKPDHCTRCKRIGEAIHQAILKDAP